METNWKAKSIAPIEKEIFALDKQIAELTLQKAVFEKALSLFKGVAHHVPGPGKSRGGRPKKQSAAPPQENQAAG